MQITLRDGRYDDAREVGQILHEVFSEAEVRHGFAIGFPSLGFGRRFAAAVLARADVDSMQRSDGASRERRSSAHVDCLVCALSWPPIICRLTRSIPSSDSRCASCVDDDARPGARSRTG